jgi:putative methyltransferase
MKVVPHNNLGCVSVGVVAAESLVRSDPSQDRTNGFFVACFVRRGPDDPDARKPSQGQAIDRKRTFESVDLLDKGTDAPSSKQFKLRRKKKSLNKGGRKGSNALH